jgi:hypothetical protein
VTDDEGDPTGERELTGNKLLSVNKGNLAAPEDRKTLVFKLEPKTLAPPHDEITVARVKWEGVKEVTARDIWQVRNHRHRDMRPSSSSKRRCATRTSRANSVDGSRPRSRRRRRSRASR